jgi:hypothetical protein
MKQNLRKVTLAASAFVFAGLFSFGWSEQSGFSLSVEKAEARVGRPLTPMSVARVAPTKPAGRLRIRLRRGGRCRHRGRGRHGGRYRRHLALLHGSRLGQVALTTVVLFGEPGRRRPDCAASVVAVA